MGIAAMPWWMYQENTANQVGLLDSRRETQGELKVLSGVDGTYSCGQT